MHLFVIGVSTAAACLAALAALPPAAFGDDPVVNLPGLAVTAGDLVDAARRAGATGAIGSRPDAEIEAMVGSWPRTAKADRARALGLPGDDNLDAVVLEYLESGT